MARYWTTITCFELANQCARSYFKLFYILCETTNKAAATDEVPVLQPYMHETNFYLLSVTKLEIYKTELERRHASLNTRA